jgi:hypothetical protein
MDDFNARDLFAGLAMAGWMGSARLELPLKFDELAKTSYDVADAMLKEKEKRDGYRGSGIATDSLRRKPKADV